MHYSCLSDSSAFNAFWTSCRRSSFSSLRGRLGSPVTCTMPFPRTTRFEPTILAMGRAEVTCTTGMPAFSSSVVIAAPLRVLVPQVDVRMTASTPLSFTFWAISLPIRRVLDKGVDAGLLKFCRYRSAATSAGASGGCENDGINAFVLHLLGHLLAHSSRVGQRR